MENFLKPHQIVERSRQYNIQFSNDRFFISSHNEDEVSIPDVFDTIVNMRAMLFDVEQAKILSSVVENALEDAEKVIGSAFAPPECVKENINKVQVFKSILMMLKLLSGIT